MCQNYFLSLKNEEGDYFSFEICLVLLEQFSKTDWMTMEEEPCSRGTTLHKPPTFRLSLSSAPQEHSCAPQQKTTCKVWVHQGMHSLPANTALKIVSFQIDDSKFM